MVELNLVLVIIIAVLLVTNFLTIAYIIKSTAREVSKNAQLVELFIHNSNEQTDKVMAFNEKAFERMKDAKAEEAFIAAGPKLPEENIEEVEDELKKHAHPVRSLEG